MVCKGLNYTLFKKTIYEMDTLVKSVVCMSYVWLSYRMSRYELAKI